MPARSIATLVVLGILVALLTAVVPPPVWLVALVVALWTAAVMLRAWLRARQVRRVDQLGRLASLGR